MVSKQTISEADSAIDIQKVAADEEAMIAHLTPAIFRADTRPMAAAHG